MGLRSGLVRLLGRDMLAEVAAEAAKVALSESTNSGGIDPDEYMWRSLTGGRRDLPQITHQRAQNICYTLYQQNPLGHRLTELIPDFVVGDGIVPVAHNPEVASVVNDFWDDTVNDMPIRSHDFGLELGLYGELVPEVLVGEISGVVQLGYIDPGQIKRVEVDPKNPLLVDKVWIRSKGAGQQGKPLDVVRERDGKLAGDVFYLRVNAVSNSTRGWPDLLHVADWLDTFDQMLWEMLERARLARSFIWDVGLDGASQSEIDEWLRKHGSAPRSGSVRAHNDKVTWSAVAPVLGSFETVEEASAIKEHIASGFGVPKTWLSSGDEVGRSAAQEMGAPTVRRLMRRQAYYLRRLDLLVRFVVEKGVEKKLIETNSKGLVPIYDTEGNPTDELAKPWKTVTLQAPEISARDAFRAGGLIAQTAQALAQAEESGWFGQDVSRRVIAELLGQIGVQVDPKSMTGTPAPPTPDKIPASDPSGNAEVVPIASRN
jgi:hypothetical protein